MTSRLKTSRTVRAKLTRPPRSATNFTILATCARDCIFRTSAIHTVMAYLDIIGVAILPCLIITGRRNNLSVYTKVTGIWTWRRAMAGECLLLPVGLVAEDEQAMSRICSSKFGFWPSPLYHLFGLVVWRRNKQ